jgi:hypothetical protein
VILLLLACGLHPWQMADGKWQMANGRWQMANGKWQMADGKWQMADDPGLGDEIRARMSGPVVRLQDPWVVG